MTTTQPDLLQGLGDAETENVLALGTRMVIPSGANLFELGEAAESIFLVERGRLKLTLPMQVRGKSEDVLVEERNAGGTVGWSALIPPYRFTLKATALLETEVIALTRSGLCAYFDAHPEVGYIVSMNLARVIGGRLQLYQAMWLRQMQRTVEMSCA
jgi:CRP-like cAMP-binding protein